MCYFSTFCDVFMCSVWIICVHMYGVLSSKMPKCEMRIALSDHVNKMTPICIRLPCHRMYMNRLQNIYLLLASYKNKPNELFRIEQNERNTKRKTV